MIVRRVVFSFFLYIFKILYCRKVSEIESKSAVLKSIESSNREHLSVSNSDFKELVVYDMSSSY